MRKSFFMLLALSASLGACVPMTEVYYRPTAASGTAIKDLCAGLVAPSDTMRFRAGKAELRVKVVGSTLYVLVRVPAGSTVLFSSPEITVSMDGQVQLYHLDRFGYYDAAQGSSTVPAIGPLVGGDIRTLVGPTPRIFSSFLSLQREPSVGVVQLPRLMVDGEEILLPPVSFTREKGFAIRPLNC